MVGGILEGFDYCNFRVRHSKKKQEKSWIQISWSFITPGYERIESGALNDHSCGGDSHGRQIILESCNLGSTNTTLGC